MLLFAYTSTHRHTHNKHSTWFRWWAQRFSRTTLHAASVVQRVVGRVLLAGRCLPNQSNDQYTVNNACAPQDGACARASVSTAADSVPRDTVGVCEPPTHKGAVQRRCARAMLACRRRAAAHHSTMVNRQHLGLRDSSPTGASADLGDQFSLWPLAGQPRSCWRQEVAAPVLPDDPRPGREKGGTVDCLRKEWL